MSEALEKTKTVSLADDTDWQEQQEIPEEKTNQAFVELGLSTITLRKIKGYKRVAQVLKRVGMVEYERGRLLHREMHLEVAREKLAELCVNSEDTDLIVSAAHAMQLIVQAENKTAELNIRLEELAKTTDQNQKMTSDLPPPGLVLGVTVNNHPAPTTDSVQKDAKTVILDQ